jgi:hypothetical protein
MISKRRRSTMSASAPAGKAKRNTGKVVAVCTIATINVEGESVVINQAAPTSFIHVPILDTTVVVHNSVNAVCRKGDQATLCPCPAGKGCCALRPWLILLIDSISPVWRRVAHARRTAPLFLLQFGIDVIAR